MRLPILIISFFLFVNISFAQLPAGSSAPNINVTDINGGSFSLYSHTSAGKGAVLDFFATWCGPCWTFHNSGVLTQVVNQLGAISTVVGLEADFRTNTGCIINSGCNYSTIGNWATVPYQLANLSSTNGPSVASQYQLAYYPTLYVISHDNRAYEIRNKSYSKIRSFLQESFFLDANPVIGSASCGGDGFIDLNRVKGYGSITYDWSNGETTEDLNGLNAGTYSVTVTDQNGYDKVFGPFVISGPSQALELEVAHIEDVDCYGSTSGSAEVFGTGGNHGYSYQWSSGHAGPVATDLAAGTYRVTVTDVQGCTEERLITIDQPAPLGVTGQETRETCGRGDGQIFVNATGGVTPYTYDIGNGHQSSSTFINLTAGSYSIEVKDANDCLTDYNTDVDHIDGPDAHSGIDLTLDCSEPELIISGTGSSGPDITYLWTTDDGEIIGDSTDLDVRVAEPGEYFFNVTDQATGCVTSDTTEIIEGRIYPLVEFDSVEIITCLQTEVRLSTLRDSHTTYNWTTPDGHIVGDSDSSTIIADQSGWYFLSAEDTLSSCVIEDSLLVLADKVIPDFEVSGPQEQGCPQHLLLLEATELDSNRNYSFSWTTVDGSFTGQTDLMMVQIDAPGTYELEVTDVTNGCRGFRSFEVTENWNLAESAFNYSIDALEVVFEDVSKGENLTWEWDFGDGAISTEQNPDHIYGAEGTYTVCLKVENECGPNSACQDIEVSEQRGPIQIARSTIEHVSCFEGNDGSITIEIIGGYPPYETTWGHGATGTQIMDLPAGQYTLTVKDDNDDVHNQDFIVNEPDELVLETVETTLAGQSTKGSITLNMAGGTPDYEYNWSNGGVSNPLTDLEAGEYWCTITDANECEMSVGPIEVDMSTSVLDQAKQVEVYPNPTNSVLCISGVNMRDVTKLMAIDLVGRRMEFDSREECLDVSILSAGSYMIRLESKSGEFYYARWVNLK